MRRLVILAGFGLAVLQLSHLASADAIGAADSPRLVPTAQAATVGGVSTALLSCERRHRLVAAACSPGDGRCTLAASDAWDVCEATGFWPR